MVRDFEAVKPVRLPRIVARLLVTSHEGVHGPGGPRIRRVQRIVVLGPGAAGKSVLSRRLGQLLDLPVVELDALFWKARLEPTPPEEWEAIQKTLIERERWILDGDLGPYDLALGPRLAAADAVIVLDFSPWLCVWRTLRRGPEQLDYWRWLLSWRRVYRPRLLESISAHAAGARVEFVSSRKEVGRLLSEAHPCSRTS